MDKILFNRMEFYGYHGVYKEENVLGQRFYVDLEIGMDLSRAGKSDQLEDTVNYAELYQLVQQVMEKEKYALIETAAEQCTQRILSTFPLVEDVCLRLIKPDPPIPGHYKSVGVEIHRKRTNSNES